VLFFLDPFKALLHPPYIESFDFHFPPSQYAPSKRPFNAFALQNGKKILTKSIL
jgi:hypothetical protein